MMMKLRKALIASATAAAVSMAGIHAPAMADEATVDFNADTVATQTAGSSVITAPFKAIAKGLFGENYTMESITKQISKWVALLTSIASVFTAVVSISTSVNKLSTTLATGK
ncbi:MAG: hypothetical protein Q3972_07515 [Corynebacterium sp.]|nr:hypothetical protein [Corynebacterium sp.]